MFICCCCCWWCWCDSSSAADADGAGASALKVYSTHFIAYKIHYSEIKSPDTIFMSSQKDLLFSKEFNLLFQMQYKITIHLVVPWPVLCRYECRFHWRLTLTPAADDRLLNVCSYDRAGFDWLEIPFGKLDILNVLLKVISANVWLKAVTNKSPI